MIKSAELLDRAHRVRQTVRRREPVYSDTLLVTTQSSHFESACGVHTLSSKDMKDGLTEQLAARNPDIGKSERVGARLSLQALSSQQRDSVSQFRFKNVYYSDMLPGGAPIVDHLAAHVSSDPGYHGLASAVEKLRNMRNTINSRSCGREQHLDSGISVLGASAAA